MRIREVCRAKKKNKAANAVCRCTGACRVRVSEIKSEQAREKERKTAKEIHAVMPCSFALWQRTIAAKTWQPNCRTAELSKRCAADGPNAGDAHTSVT